MNALVIYESMFGNTRRIAEAIADGLRSAGTEVTTTDIADAPRTVPTDVDLLVVGGPTHAFSMSRSTTRSDAVARGADDKDVSFGIREWITGLPDQPHPHDFAAFDTRSDVPLLPGAASKSLAKAARARGFRSVARESFLVSGYEGPLVDGELERARAWGGGLAPGSA